MTPPVLHLRHGYKSGLGIEVARISSLLRRLAKTQQVLRASYDGHLYARRWVTACTLEEHLEPVVDPLPEGLAEVADVLPSRERYELCTVNLRVHDLLGWLGRQDAQAP